MIFCRSFELVVVVNDEVGSILRRFGRRFGSLIIEHLSIRRTSIDGFV